MQSLSRAGLVSCHSANLQPCQCKLRQSLSRAGLVSCHSANLQPCQCKLRQSLSSAGLASCHTSGLQPCQSKSHALLVVVGINPVKVRTAVSCHGHSASSTHVWGKTSFTDQTRGVGEKQRAVREDCRFVLLSCAC